MSISTFVVLATLAATTARAAGPQVRIVVGAKAEAIEKFAADELSAQLKKLFDADVTIGEGAAGENVIYLGTRQSCPIAEKLGDAWPALSERGEAIKTVKIDNKKALLVVGGSPRAVLWAAYELGWVFGIRYFRFGDLYPTTPPTFSLEYFDKRSGPKYKSRAWNGLQASPFGLDALGLDDIRSLLRQLGKQRFDVVHWNVSEIETGVLLGGALFPVDGDTVGRSAFKGARYFDNPDLSSADSAVERQEAAKRLITQVVSEGAGLGIQINAGVLPKNSTVPTASSLLPTPYEIGQLTNRNPDLDFRDTELVRHTYLEIFDPVCGEGVAERVMKAFDSCKQAVKLFAGDDSSDRMFGIPEKSMLLKYYDSTEPPPAWWGEVRTHYLNAMNEMYRANTRAREGGRAFTLYYARRFEFGFEYMNAVEALRKAAIAKAAGDKDEQIAQLEKALDSITGACNAMAAVARSQSDRGVIAVMNEYGYRPVMKLLEEADAGN